MNGSTKKRSIIDMFRSRKRPHMKTCVLDVLSRILGLEQLERLVVSTTDRRTLVQTAARIGSLPEMELVKQIAARAGLECLGEVPPVDLVLLGDAIRLADFRRAGAIPYVKEGKLAGVVCMDPGLIEPLCEQRKLDTIFISSWLLIAQALEESERRYVEQKDAVERTKRDRLDRAASAVLGLVLEEVESFGQEQMEIVLRPDEIQYLFMTAEGRSGKGNIHPSLRESLARLFSKEHTRRECHIATGKSDRIVTAKIEVVEHGAQYRIRWGAALAALQESEQQTAQQTQQTSPAVESSGATESSAMPLRSSGAHSSEEVHQNSDEIESDDGDSGLVLLVDDNVTFLRVLERFFGRHGLTTVMAENGVEAIRKLESGEVQPDMVICDVHMPHMNGPEFLKRLKQIPSLAHLPVVMLTSDTDVEMEISLLDAGADAFVTKDEDPRVLCTQVRRLVRVGKQRALKLKAA